MIQMQLTSHVLIFTSNWLKEAIHGLASNLYDTNATHKPCADIFTSDWLKEAISRAKQISSTNAYNKAIPAERKRSLVILLVVQTTLLVNGTSFQRSKEGWTLIFSLLYSSRPQINPHTGTYGTGRCTHNFATIQLLYNHNCWMTIDYQYSVILPSPSCTSSGRLGISANKILRCGHGFSRGGNFRCEGLICRPRDSITTSYRRDWD